MGVRFEGDRGAAFFRSTLVQTLFYGVFSAWVLWARQTPPPTGAFEWRTAVWHLRAPVLRALFQQLSGPGRLRPLGLVEVLDWTAAALDRVDRPAFFARFDEGEAVTYFYEPFLEAFDPDLRKQLGVWYTPAEVGALHGRPRRPRPQGRPRHRRTGSRRITSTSSIPAAAPAPTSPRRCAASPPTSKAAASALSPAPR